MRLKKPEMICASLLLSFTFCIYAPIEIYLANRNEFWFNISTIGATIASCFAMVALMCITVGIFLKDTLYRLFLGMIFSIGICFYVQGNFLNMRVGTMNGAEIMWRDYTSGMIGRLVVWLIIIAAVEIALIKLKDNAYLGINVVAIVLIAMQVMMLVPNLIKATNEGNVFGSASEEFLSSDGLYTVGDEGNVIVFVLDAFDGTYMDEIQNDPRFMKQLDGFTLYDNYTGLYPQTEYSIANLINGKIFRNEMPRLQWVESQSDQRIYIDERLDNGYDISIYTDMPEDVPSRISEACDNHAKAYFRFYNSRIGLELIYRLVGCKYLPDILKPYIWMEGTEFDGTAISSIESSLYNNDNAVFRDGMRANGLNIENGHKKFKFIHIHGAHEPFRIDEHGEDIDENWDQNIAAAKGCLQLTLDYIQNMKNLGVYDNSSIVITADHGWHGGNGIITNPVLMVKEAGKDIPFEVKNVPVSQADMPATVLKLAKCDNIYDYGMPVMNVQESSGRDRLYYQYTYTDNEPIRNGNFCLVEYRADEDVNDTDLFELTDVEYTWTGSKISHKEYCKTCQDGEKPTEYCGRKQLVHNHADNYPD